MVKNILSLGFWIVILFSSSVCMAQKGNSTFTLEGNWELNYITGPKVTFNILFPNKKPALYFDLKEKRVAGFNGCNSFSGVLKTEDKKIDFSQPFAVTKMACTDPEGESVFMHTIQRIDSYSFSKNGKTLNLISDNSVLMRFSKI
ncbi:META domain-containing protein [uncultured Flavobacterium sp.]|uniref:META domain-containing protein n=1 Tax=uncultured Flavobacterium sp. TaxID=165435 RepID=UPI0030813275